MCNRMKIMLLYGRVISQMQSSRGTPLTRQMMDTPLALTVHVQSTMSSNSSVSISHDPTIAAVKRENITHI